MSSQEHPGNSKEPALASEPEPAPNGEVALARAAPEPATPEPEPTPTAEPAPAANAEAAPAANAEPASEATAEPAPSAEPEPALEPQPAEPEPAAVAEPELAEAEPAPGVESAPAEPEPQRAKTLAPPSQAVPVTERAGHGHVVPRGRYLAGLCVGALGVVYGDVGTSPLYAIRECFDPHHGLAVTRPNVLGVLSLIFWSLTIVITLKYLFYVLRADNRGEGGVLALMALALGTAKGRMLTGTIVALGLFGAALLYGDGMITPAISVLGAMEGLVVATTAFEHWVVPLTVVIIIGLFLPQKYGTAKVGRVFGPIVFVWFVAIAAIGMVHILRVPEVLWAFSPHYAFEFALTHGKIGFVVMGSVFLVVTGGEALYADMGHFGPRPIRLMWLCVAGPALLINYFGQGALLISDPAARANPFFLAAPRWALYPLVALSLMAAIIASQAVISGAFSLTRQATMLGFWPRVEVRHTSAREIGQIYVPSINWLLMFATIGLVLGFGSSSKLAAAYGIAVTATMVITTLLAYVVARKRWGWSLGAALGLTIVFVTVDLAFLGANALKIAHGGWFPLVVGAAIFALMTTWKQGRQVLGERIKKQIVPLDDFFELMRIERPARVPGTGLFMTSNPQGTPPSLMQNFLLNRVVHQEVILLTIATTEQARVMPDERVEIEHLPEGFVRVVARYGFMEQPDIPALLEERHIPDWTVEHTTFFLGHESLLPAEKGELPRWRHHLFWFMSRNSQRAATFFNIPSHRALEIGTPIEL
jgi:KUP system potassium uptake protein